MDSPKGIFILIAGANASGKTTVIRPKYVKGRVKHELDPDRLSSDIRPYILSEKARNEYGSNRPGRFAFCCMKDWLASEHIYHEGIATESNLVSHVDFDNFRMAKDNGMQTELYFVGVPLEIALQREQSRVDKDEQEKIPENTIRRRHGNGIRNIKEHIASGNIDVIKIYDNSRGKGEEQLILHIENGKTIYLHPDQPEWM